MTEKKRNKLIIKYIFTFDIEPEQWQDPTPDNFWKTLFSGTPIEFEALAGIDILPKEWDFFFWPLRRKPAFSKWHQLRVVDAGEEGGHAEKKYTYYVAFNSKYKDEVMEFLKFVDQDDEHNFYEE